MGLGPKAVKPERAGGGDVGVVWIKVAAVPRTHLMTRKVLSQRVFDSAPNPVAVSDAAPGTPA